MINALRKKPIEIEGEPASAVTPRPEEVDKRWAYARASRPAMLWLTS
jgi:hypothetical protein